MKVIPVYSVHVWDGGDRTNFATPTAEAQMLCVNG